MKYIISITAFFHSRLRTSLFSKGLTSETVIDTYEQISFYFSVFIFLVFDSMQIKLNVG